MMNGQANIR